MNQKVKEIRQIIVAFVLLAAISGFSSCEKFSYKLPDVDPNATWKLSTDIQPIFNSNCIACHSGSQAPDLRSGKSFQSLTTGGYVNISVPESSTIYVKIESSTHRARTPDMTDNDRKKILYWITQGALEN
jgi:hypothetical protein